MRWVYLGSCIPLGTVFIVFGFYLLWPLVQFITGVCSLALGLAMISVFAEWLWGPEYNIFYPYVRLNEKDFPQHGRT